MTLPAAATEYPNPPLVATGTSGPTPGQTLQWNAATNAFEYANTQTYPVGPTGFIRENFSRANTPKTDSTALTAGTVLVAGFAFVGGDIVSKLCVVTGATAASTPTHQWAALCDANLNVLAVSADGLTAAIAAQTEIDFTMAAAYTIPTSGLFYVAVNVSGTTAPSLLSLNDPASTILMGLAPKLCGTAGSATTPPTVASQINSGTITAGVSRFWCGAK